MQQVYQQQLLLQQQQQQQQLQQQEQPELLHHNTEEVNEQVKCAKRGDDYCSDNVTSLHIASVYKCSVFFNFYYFIMKKKLYIY